MANKKNVKKKAEKIKQNEINNSKKYQNVKKKKHIFLIIIISLLIFFLLIGIAFAIYIVVSAPKFSKSALYNKEMTILYETSGKEYARLGSEKRELVNYEDLPNVLVDAIIATEDSRFYQHNGFDIARFSKAVIGQLSGHSNAGGASTLTMQVVKNTFTSTEASGIKGIIRKFTDIYMSIFKVESNYTKEEIIEFYVNAPFLGNSAYGVEQASQTYFGKSVRDLSLSEAALIAGMFQAPNAYNPYSNPEAATKRRATVLNLMYKHGYITEEQKNLANNVSVQSLLLPKNQISNNNEYQAFVDTVVEEVIKKTGNNPYNVPMLIYTTMDSDKQKVLNDIMNGSLVEFPNDVVQNGIAITSVKDGSVVAVGAGRNRVGERQYNYATMISRMPGSAAKPFFAYGPLIEYNNASPATYFFDLPYAYSNGQSLKNAEGGFRGMMNMRTALSTSRNIPAIQAFQQVDKEKISEFVHNLGLHYGENLYESAAIGGYTGSSPLEMSAAYATLARGGTYIEPYSYTKIIYRETKKEEESKINKKQAMSDSTAFLLTDILHYAVTDKNLYGKINSGGTELAGKTGTSTIDPNARKKYHLPSSAVMDSWANIYSQDYAASIWYGYPDASKGYYLTINSGGAMRKKIAQLLGSKVLNTGSKFKIPNSVVKAQYALNSIPLSKGTSGTDWFKKGTEPTEVTKFEGTDENLVPSNVKASESNGSINISWEAPEVQNSGDVKSTKDYFNKLYGKFADSFYNEYLKYGGQTSGGAKGYTILVTDPSGASSTVGSTTSTSITYTPSKNGTYTFSVNGVTTSVNVTSVKEETPKAKPVSIKLRNGSISSGTLHITSESDLNNYDFVDSNGNTITCKDATKPTINGNTVTYNAGSLCGNASFTYSFTIESTTPTE